MQKGKIRKTITVKWLQKEGAIPGCINGFLEDFGNNVPTRKVVGALTMKNYPKNWDYYLLTLNDFLGCPDCPIIKMSDDCRPSACSSVPLTKVRNAILRELKKVGA